jgi:predicted transcriptional regulator YdeE
MKGTCALTRPFSSQETVFREAFRVAGLSVRTCNRAEMAAGPEARIAPLVGRWFGENLAHHMPGRVCPGKALLVYSGYTQHGAEGDYTFTIGEEVDPACSLPCLTSLACLTIPAQRYLRLTSCPGPIPEVSVALWQAVWRMTPAELGGERSWLGDFEVYDERSRDPGHTVLDLFVGLR